MGGVYSIIAALSNKKLSSAGYIKRFQHMQENEADFTLTFRRLCYAAFDPEMEGTLRNMFKEAGASIERTIWWYKWAYI